MHERLLAFGDALLGEPAWLSKLSVPLLGYKLLALLVWALLAVPRSERLRARST